MEELFQFSTVPWFFSLSDMFPKMTVTRNVYSEL